MFDPQEKYLDEHIKISLPVCMLSLIPVDQETNMEKRLLSQNKIHQSEELNNLKLINRNGQSRYKK